MSLRPGAWLAPVAVVALLAGGAAAAIHSQTVHAPVAQTAQSTVRGATTSVDDSGDLVPANTPHLPYSSTHPSPSPVPSTPARPPASPPTRAPAAPAAPAVPA